MGSPRAPHSGEGGYQRGTRVQKKWKIPKNVPTWFLNNLRKRKASQPPLGLGGGRDKEVSGGPFCHKIRIRKSGEIELIRFEVGVGPITPNGDEWGSRKGGY